MGGYGAFIWPAYAIAFTILVGLFAVGLKPSGTKDPFALRRAALGIVQVLLGRKLHIDLPGAIAMAAQQLPVPADESVQSDVLDYIVQRLRGLLLEEGVRYDVIDAVLTERRNDLYRIAQTAWALDRWVRRGDWMDLLNAYARCVRIVRDQQARYTVDPQRFTEPASTILYQALQQAQATIPESAVTPDHLLAAIQTLVPAINAFFDQVLVMDPDLAARENRLGLLQAIAALTTGVIDLSRLEGF